MAFKRKFGKRKRFGRYGKRYRKRSRRSFRRRSGPEKKFLLRQSSSVIITPGGGGEFFDISNNIFKGTDSQTRIGAKLTWKSLYMRLQFWFGSYNFGAGVPHKIRFMIFIWNNASEDPNANTGGGFNRNTIFEQGVSDLILAPKRHSLTTKMTILMDKVVILDFISNAEYFKRYFKKMNIQNTYYDVSVSQTTSQKRLFLWYYSTDPDAENNYYGVSWLTKLSYTDD